MEILKRESTREKIREYILKCIMDGTFLPGQWLREVELARMLGTSQAPVREALRDLEGLHYVVTIPYKGTQVRELSAKDVADAYLLRGLLDKAAAEVACEKPGEDWSSLRSIADKAMEIALEGDREEYSRIDAEFHKTIIKASKIWMLEHFWNLLSFATQIRSALYMLDIPLTYYAKQHYPIVEALEQNDGQTAGKLLYEHAYGVRKRLMEK